MKVKSLVAVALVVLLALAAYWYGSPFPAVRQLQTAAQYGDAETNADRLGLVFERNGFADWTLTEIRMPLAAFQD